jgi:hypothetical protein
MFLARFGSLNSLDKTRPSRVWSEHLDGQTLPSADTLGRVAALVDPAPLREELYAMYQKLRANKALAYRREELVALVFDGHESTSSYRRSCPGCLEREVGPPGDRRIQHYHRYVVCSLVGPGFHVFLDAEPVLKGEGEVLAARRLYARVHPLYSRAYDVVVADGLYMEGPFFEDVLARGKHVMAVLKREDLRLFQDAEALFAETEPVAFRARGRQHQCWDLSGFTSLATVSRPLRVVKSVESWETRRQLSGELEATQSRWMWATTLSTQQADTREMVRLGHSRWSIENQGFNEAVNHYHMDHVYRHDPTAMLVLLLLAMLAINIFQTFYRRNRQPAFRARYSRLDLARMIIAVFYVSLDLADTS